MIVFGKRKCVSIEGVGGGWERRRLEVDIEAA